MRVWCDAFCIYYVASDERNDKSENQPGPISLSQSFILLLCQFDFEVDQSGENLAILWHILFSLELTLRYRENDPATFNISCEVKLATLAQISDHKELPTLGSNEKKKGKF